MSLLYILQREYQKDVNKIYKAEFCDVNQTRKENNEAILKNDLVLFLYACQTHNDVQSKNSKTQRKFINGKNFFAFQCDLGFWENFMSIILNK